MLGPSEFIILVKREAIVMRPVLVMIRLVPERSLEEL